MMTAAMKELNAMMSLIDLMGLIDRDIKLNPWKKTTIKTGGKKTAAKGKGVKK